LQHSVQLASLQHSVQLAFETHIGVRIVHAYVGMVAYVGTRLNCGENKFDIVTFARAEARITAFGRTFQFIEMAAELRKRWDDDLHDNVRLSLFNVRIFSSKFIPGDAREFIDSCEKAVVPLLPGGMQRRPTPPFRLQLWFGLMFFIQVEISVMTDLEFETIVCPGRITMTVTPTPIFIHTVAFSAGVWILVVEGGVKAKIQARYKLLPRIGTSNCNLCTVLSHEVPPITLDIYVFAIFFHKELRLATLWSKVLHGGFRQELFRICLFPGRAFDPESSLETESNNDNPPDMYPPATEPINAGEEPGVNPEINTRDPNVCQARLKTFRRKVMELEDQVRFAVKSKVKPTIRR